MATSVAPSGAYDTSCIAEYAPASIGSFTSADGAVLNRNRRTVVLRNPLQES